MKLILNPFNNRTSSYAFSVYVTEESCMSVISAPNLTWPRARVGVGVVMLYL